jgi:hypothetical protein
MRRPLVIYDFATAPLWISLHMRKILFSFLSVFNAPIEKQLMSFRSSAQTIIALVFEQKAKFWFYQQFQVLFLFIFIHFYKIMKSASSHCNPYTSQKLLTSAPGFKYIPNLNLHRKAERGLSHCKPLPPG